MKKGFRMIENPKFNVLNNDELNELEGGICICNVNKFKTCVCNVNKLVPCVCNANKFNIF